MKRVVSNTDGFTLHGWMVTILGLGGNELLVFIYLMIRNKGYIGSHFASTS